MQPTPKSPEGPPPMPEPTAEPVAAAEPAKPAEAPAPDTAGSDTPPEVKSPEPATAKKHHKLKAWVMSHKKLAVLGGLIGLLVLLAVIPMTRYHAAGLVLKQNVSLKVLDATTNTPVSGATVSAGGTSAQTDQDGQVNLKLKDGWQLVTVSKNYYNQTSSKLLVPILRQKSVPTVALTANGRQVSIAVDNAVSAQPLSGVSITVAGIQAKTDASGKATVVLPPNQPTQTATLSLAGFNDSKVTVQISANQIAQNNYHLVPAGRVYFLSNSSGTLDVVSTNIDGSGKKTLLTGTGNEENFSTTMVVSPDNKYVALLTNRNGSNELIYMISTASGAINLVDKADATYEIYGWVGEALVYSSTSNTTQTWQSGYEQLKAYNSSSSHVGVVAKSAATGNASASAYEQFGYVSLTADGKIIFSKEWTQGNYANTVSLSAKANTLNLVNVDGSTLTTIAKYPTGDSVSYSQYTPNYIYIQQNHGSATSYFNYKIGDSGAAPVAITSSLFYKNRPYFFYSPDGRHNLWSEVRNGKNTLLVGDASGANPKTIDQDSDYDAYGWYNNDYVLLSKNKDELYIQSANGGALLKISNYESTNSPGAAYYGGSTGRGGGGY